MYVIARFNVIAGLDTLQPVWWAFISFVNQDVTSNLEILQRVSEPLLHLAITSFPLNRYQFSRC